MKKSNKKFDLILESYGIYTRWNKNSRDLPEIVKFTDQVPAQMDTEFGMILRIKKGKGVKLGYCIKHPPFRDNKGNVEPEFTGYQMITSNDYLFFIGDCIWEPVSDKAGEWIIELFFKDEMIMSRRFIIYNET